MSLRSELAQKDLKVCHTTEGWPAEGNDTQVGMGGELGELDATGVPWECQPVWYQPDGRGTE